jgi:uncharacterized protein YceK
VDLMQHFTDNWVNIYMKYYIVNADVSEESQSILRDWVMTRGNFATWIDRGTDSVIAVDSRLGISPTCVWVLDHRIYTGIIMKLVIAILAVTLSGCSTVKSWVPSFGDPNQSAAIVDVQQSIAKINCEQPQVPQVTAVADRVQWFMLYSNSKGWRQQDVIKLVKPIEETTDAWVKRGEGSKTYCLLKKQVLQQQSARAAEAVLGRF